MKKLISLLFGMVLLAGCNNNILYISSPDKENYLTIITRDEVRYIIDGKHKKVPDHDYIKLDISQTTTLSDAIYVCWYGSDKSGEIIMPKTIIIENKLNPTHYTFNNQLPEDENGIPRPTKFAGGGCTSVGFTYKKAYPKGSAIVDEDYTFF